MLSTWILISIIGTISLIYGIPQYVDLKLSGPFALILGIVATAIGITGIMYCLC